MTGKDVDRLTRQDVEAVLVEGMCKVRCSEPCLCSRVRDLALQSLSQEAVRIPREHLSDALNYIKHCGANAVMRGEPHPQQKIVDRLESALKREPNAAAAEGPAHGLPCWPVDRPAPAVVELIAQLHDMAFALEKQGSEHWAMNCGYAAALLAKLGQAQPRMKLYQLCEKHKGITSYRVKVSSATFPSETVCPVCEEPTPGVSDD